MKTPLREHWRNLVCPDCAARADHNRLRHHDGCPVGDGYDTIQADDRAFFDRYPDVDVRRRKPVLAELLDVALTTGITLPPNPWQGMDARRLRADLPHRQPRRPIQGLRERLPRRRPRPRRTNNLDHT